MRRTAKCYLFTFSLLLFPVSLINRPDPVAENLNPRQTSKVELLQQMISRIRRTNSLEFSMKVIYRIKGKQIEKRGRFKLVNNPFKIYYKQDYPRKGLEILYVEGMYNNRILVNPNAFPWINFTLNPLGKVMMEDRHQTIYEAGFYAIADILGAVLEEYFDNLDEIIHYYGVDYVSGIKCHHLAVEIPDFRFIDYITRNGETVASIAEKRKISRYMIMENNSSLSNSRKALGTRKIEIPTCYAKRFDLYIDVEHLVPTVLKIYDDKGLYESFEFSKIQLDVSFHPNEFTRSYSEYGFR